MTAKPRVKLIKKEDLNPPEPEAEVINVVKPDAASTVKSWVSEFKKDREDEALTAFDAIFK